MTTKMDKDAAVLRRDLWRVEAGRGKIVFWLRASDDIAMALESEETLLKVQPDFDAPARVACRCHVVTAKANGECDFLLSRGSYV
jgi:predicted PhzF superfamily epimerase YddE/YHI9